MNDKLEKLIKENRSSFDDLTPPSDMWSNIEGKLATNRKISPKTIIYRISGAAAILIVAIFSYTLVFSDRAQNDQLSAMNNEILETEQYYNLKVLQKKEQVFKLTSSQPEIKKDIEEELALLDTAMLELKNDLKENISNTEVVEAMIQNYRMKLQILEDILQYIEPQEKKETQNDFSNI